MCDVDVQAVVNAADGSVRRYAAKTDPGDPNLPAEAARRAALLARHLREHANHIPDDLQPFATDVVTRLLRIFDGRIYRRVEQAKVSHG